MYKIKLLFCVVFFIGCKSKDTLFKKQSSDHTNIHFANTITENDSVNPIDLEFLYNGGGVAAGDFNNDGLQDLYFTGSQVSNKLYLNKGDFVFNDITEEARVNGEGRWSNGASVVDINSDGLQDIYVCATIYKDALRRKNLLYINEGINANGIPVFKEMAEEYHLADTGFSVQAAFFDYDNDGDLDIYLLQTKLAQRDVVKLSGRNADSVRKDADKLFRNDWNEVLHHPVYTDVSKQAGITEPGYGLGLNIADINNDGWKDIYVTNDFYDNDLLYINNHDGTFTNKAAVCFDHTSQNAMGNDIADINGDGLPDVLAVDMNPEDNYRKKKNMGGNNYYVYQSMISEGYILQYVRNTLQLNMGARILSNDTLGEPVFSDISYYAGVAETDWSWNASIADFDNDGLRDIFITNGYPRDVTDHDFLAFRARSGKIATKERLIEEIPSIKISNYAYHNKGNTQFENLSAQWGLDEPSFSNGAIYADLDNDGDLDYVVNNINGEAFVYQNKTNSNKATNTSFLKIKFKGGEKNKDGIGATATVYYDKGHKQVWENAPCRGYLSCVENSVLFGLKAVTVIDSVVIQWNNNLVENIKNVKPNQVLTVFEKNAHAQPLKVIALDSSGLFTDVTAKAGVSYKHAERDYIDFNDQRLLPHKFSEYGPGIAVGDIDGNGYEDMCIGGTQNQPVTFLLQQANGKFIIKNLMVPGIGNLSETEGLLLFDPDNDGDLDLYLVSGSNELPLDDINYQDRFLENDGKGNFSLKQFALPVNHTSKSCIKAADFDNDGDLDLFIGGRVLPGRYPQAVSSFIYRNDSKKGEIKFTDISISAAPSLKTLGLACDAICTDFNNDGWKDLIIAGEWMPLTFLKNDKGVFKNITASTGITNAKGWWNSITAGDFDNDGDMDYIAGNVGTNTFYHANEQNPVRVYGGDFAKNNNYAAIISLYLNDSTGNKQEYPAETRDDIVDQLPALKKQFLTYKSFARAGAKDLIGNNKPSLKLEANYFQSAYIENTGGGHFKMHALPWPAQLAPLYGMVADDFDNDGNLDIAVVGNDYGTQVSIGRYDAMKGLLMKGDGKGNFECLAMAESGLSILGNAKSFVKLKGAGNQYCLAVSQNKDALKLYKQRRTTPLIAIQPGDISALVTLKTGQKRKEEFFYGSSFLSQSSSFIKRNSNVIQIEVINNKGIKRRMDF